MRGCFLTRSHPDFNQPLKPLYYTPPPHRPSYSVFLPTPGYRLVQHPVVPNLPSCFVPFHHQIPILTLLSEF